jgi:hypothetical protein
VDFDLKLRDLSLGGFLIESPVPFSPKETYCFWIDAATGGRVFEFEARAVYCRPRTEAATLIYEIGFAFPNPRHPATEATARALIDAVTFASQLG